MVNNNLTKTNKVIILLIDGYKRIEVPIYDTPWGERVVVDGRMYSFRKDGTIY